MGNANILKCKNKHAFAAEMLTFYCKSFLHQFKQNIAFKKKILQLWFVNDIQLEVK